MVSMLYNKPNIFMEISEHKFDLFLEVHRQHLMGYIKIYYQEKYIEAMSYGNKYFYKDLRAL